MTVQRRRRGAGRKAQTGWLGLRAPSGEAGVEQGEEENVEGPCCLQAAENSLCQELGESRHGKGHRNIVDGRTENLKFKVRQFESQ